MSRDTKGIRQWMRETRWRQCHIQWALNYNKATPVWETIEGRRSSRRVLRWFIDNGCPVELLGLPDDMKEAV